MTLRRMIMIVGLTGVPQLAAAGGLLLPGAGAISTSRAGAAVASADDGEALVVNPAGIAKSKGNVITLSAAIINYAMEFQRRGTYDAVGGEAYPYEGQPYALVKNDDPDIAFGIGSFQPVPVVAFLTDLGGRIPGLHLGIGVYTPNAYPFRDLCTQQASGCERHDFEDFNTDFNVAPPPTRYDVMQQSAETFLPSLAVAYRIIPDLDVGLRLSVGRATLKSTNGLWASLGPNYNEDVNQDGLLRLEATDGFVPGFGLGIAYRPTPNLELGANYNSELDIHGKGKAESALGPTASMPLPGLMAAIIPVADEDARCAPGGTQDALKACIDLALPMSLQIGARYKFLDAAGKQKGDVEVDLGWEHWGKSCSDEALFNGECTSPSDFRVTVDGAAAVILPTGPAPVSQLYDAAIRHGFKDTYSFRVGGSYQLPIGAKRDDGESNQLILRGGLGFDTAAAKTGWLRADMDGAARTTLTVGASYRARRFEVSLGGGAILEGSPSNPNSGGGAEPCNPSQDMPSCGGSDRQGPDPIRPTSPSADQVESPVNQGDYKAHYTLLMLGVTTWF
jgi:long-subunit fatty acid transport protein